MELLNQILLNNNFKLFLIATVVLLILTMSPPINKIIYTFYNNILGKIILLGLIIYYSNSNDDMSNKLSLVLTILYILLMININTQDTISNYGNDLHKNLYGGMGHGDDEPEKYNYEEGEFSQNGGNLEEQLNSEQEEELESTEEEDNSNIDSKIENIIQEEIVLNKNTYKKRLKKERKLGADQYKLNKKRTDLMDSLEKQAHKYKNIEDEYNKIMEQVDKYDTNNDGVIDYNDVSPEEESTEMETLEEEMNHLKTDFDDTLKKMKPSQDEFDDIVSLEKTDIKGGSIELKGLSNNLYSIPI
tara:strand:- start:260 stop:1165 length:906 start_codon:yes stop_codon:yes gene_type:complete